MAPTLWKELGSHLLIAYDSPHLIGAAARKGRCNFYAPWSGLCLTLSPTSIPDKNDPVLY